MFRSTTLHAPTRRQIVIAAAVLAVVVLAAAALFDPASRSAGDARSTGDMRSAANTQADALRAPTNIGATADVATTEAAPAPAAGASKVLADTAASMIAPPELGARIIRTATIDLRVKRKGFEDAWGAAQAVATSSGGYIIGASRSGAGDAARTGTISMRVPSGRFEKAVERLRDVSGAKVTALDVASEDVTQEFVDVTSRLKHDRAVEGRLLALLADADGVSEVLAVQARLDQVQEQIEVARGRLQYLDKLTSMSTIEATITAPAVGAGADDDDSRKSVFKDAWRDAVERFSENVAGAVVWVGGALPALIMLSIIAIVARVSWRRHTRRQQAHAPDVAG